MNEQPQHFSPGKPREKATAPVPRPDRRFYAQTQAFGRFGIRWFDPQIMPEEHFHRTPAAERDTFRHLLGTAREGLRVARRRPRSRRRLRSSRR